MTLSGPDALRSLDEAQRDIRREEDDIAQRLSKSTELIAKIHETESGLLRQLAKVRLDPTTQAELTDRLSTAEKDAREKLKAHQSALADAEDKLKDHDSSIAALTTERADLVKQAAEQEARLKAIAEQVVGEASKSPDYASKRKTADELLHVAQESLSKTQQAEADREQKGRPYRDDPLFMYLWERSYGTKNYRANNLVMWLDGLVAGLVGYPEARPNFAMLNEIPLRLREHADRQQEKAVAAMAEVRGLEEAAVDAAGGKPIREALRAANDRIAKIDAETVEREDARDDAAKAQRDLAQGSDPMTSALSGLVEALGRMDIQQLLADARATRTTEDDAIVKQVEDARSRVLEEEDGTKDQKARLKTLAARRRELEDIQFEFKKQGFDNPRSTFREDNLVGDVLTDFLRGGITAASYWDQWRRSQSWTGGYDPWRTPSQPTYRRDNDDDDDDDRKRRGKTDRGFDWPDISFGGGSRSSSGGNWGRLPNMGGGGFGGGGGGGGGGSFSRPRTGSTGSRKTGGFKTGGGF